MSKRGDKRTQARPPLNDSIVMEDDVGGSWGPDRMEEKSLYDCMMKGGRSASLRESMHISCGEERNEDRTAPLGVVGTRCGCGGGWAPCVHWHRVRAVLKMEGDSAVHLLDHVTMATNANNIS